MKKLLLSLFLCYAPFVMALDDFEELMGKDNELWAHLQSDEDKAVLAKYKALYEKNSDFQNGSNSEYKIPHVIHFIWLGPRGYPAESVENIRTWIAQNPGWRVKFWTDRARPLPCEGMEIFYVQDYTFHFLGAFYEKARDWGQKSDILRYEILFREGGVYVDHDANCLRPFDKLHAAYDLYTCLELPHEPHCGRALTSGIGIVGARPDHPVLKKTMEVLVERWDAQNHASSMETQIAAFQDTISKTYMPFTLALKEAVDEEGNTDIVFPAAYFYAKGDLPSLYSKHFYAGAWKDKSTENSFSVKINKNLTDLNRNLHKNGLIALVILFVSFIVSILVWRQKKASSEKNI